MSFWVFKYYIQDVPIEEVKQLKQGDKCLYLLNLRDRKIGEYTLSISFECNEDGNDRICTRIKLVTQKMYQHIYYFIKLGFTNDIYQSVMKFTAKDNEYEEMVVSLSNKHFSAFKLMQNMNGNLNIIEPHVIHVLGDMLLTPSFNQFMFFGQLNFELDLPTDKSPVHFGDYSLNGTRYCSIIVGKNMLGRDNDFFVAVQFTKLSSPEVDLTTILKIKKVNVVIKNNFHVTMERLHEIFIIGQIKAKVMDDASDESKILFNIEFEQDYENDDDDNENVISECKDESPDQWQCNVCTLLNTSVALKCSACDTVRIQYGQVIVSYETEQKSQEKSDGIVNRVTQTLRLNDISYKLKIDMFTAPFGITVYRQEEKIGLRITTDELGTYDFLDTIIQLQMVWVGDDNTKLNALYGVRFENNTVYVIDDYFCDFRWLNDFVDVELHIIINIANRCATNETLEMAKFAPMHTLKSICDLNMSSDKISRPDYFCRLVNDSGCVFALYMVTSNEFTGYELRLLKLMKGGYGVKFKLFNSKTHMIKTLDMTNRTIQLSGWQEIKFVNETILKVTIDIKFALIKCY